MLSTLCQQCGLCCGGSLFTFLPVTRPEAERMQAWGVRVSPRRDGRLAMSLPCPALDGCRCTAYEQRPGRCREFVCALGVKLERREISFDAARTIVEEVKQALAELDDALGPSDSLRGTVSRALSYEAQEPGDPKLHTVRAAARSIQAFLRTHFVDGDVTPTKADHG